MLKLAAIPVACFTLALSSILTDIPGNKQITLNGHTGLIQAIAVSADGKLLASSGADENIRLWDCQNGKQIGYLKDNRLTYALAFSPDGKWLASGDLFGFISLWDLSKQTAIWSQREHKYTVFSIAFRPDAKLLASGSERPSLAMQRIPSGKRVFLGQMKAQKIAFSSDGKVLAAADGIGRTIYLIDAVNGKMKSKLAISDNVQVLTFTPDSKMLLVAMNPLFTNKVSVDIWDIASKKVCARVKGLEQGISAMALSPDGTLLAVADKAEGYYGGRLKLFQLETLREIGTLLDGKDHGIRGLGFTKDGHLAVANNKSITILKLSVPSK